MTRKLVASTIAAIVGAALLTACGDDDDDGDAAGAERYCELAAELDQQESEPTNGQLEAIVDAAPEEIRDDVELFADAVRTGDFSDPGIEEAEQNLMAFEEANCGDVLGGEEEE